MNEEKRRVEVPVGAAPGELRSQQGEAALLLGLARTGLVKLFGASPVVSVTTGLFQLASSRGHLGRTVGAAFGAGSAVLLAAGLGPVGAVVAAGAGAGVGAYLGKKFDEGD